MGPASRVGAVVIGRNEGDRLIRCLDSLRQRVATIVYVDSGSTDGSRTVAERRGAIVVSLASRQAFDRYALLQSRLAGRLCEQYAVRERR